MADVRPFRGLRYNTGLAGELSNIICPPFDTIPPELQRSLYHRSPYNVVRVEAGESKASDTPRDNRYARAAAQFTEWMEKQVLVRDVEPAFYLVRHTFKFRGSEEARLELMACVRLEEYQRRVVLPHEYTRDADKRDRLALMEACRANFSPVMCLYRDKSKRIPPIFQRTMAAPPLVTFCDPGEQGYSVWRIDDPVQTMEISEAMASTPLYIADGHHRYETALTYRQQRESGQSEGQTTDEAFNFAMVGLIEFEDPGLLVLPYHRALEGLGERTLDQIKARLGELFDPRPFGGGSEWDLEAFLREIELLGRDQLVIGLLDSRLDDVHVLTLKGNELDALGPIAQSEVWILQEQILRPILGNALAEHLAYVHDADEVERSLRSGKYQMGFLLKPFPLDLFETIMNMGERLPPKSTFFYPKLATGLVINRLEGEI